MMRRIPVGMALVAALFSAGCERTASDLRPWRASDHDRSEEPAGGATAAAAGPAASASGAADPTEARVETTWRTQCATCHGLTGRGDGPKGSLVRAPDLSRPDWQDRTTDSEMSAVITSGRGRMPRYDLTAGVVSGLVQRIRSLRRR